LRSNSRVGYAYGHLDFWDGTGSSPCPYCECGYCERQTSDGLICPGCKYLPDSE